MNPVLLYVLKANIAIGVFYLFYLLLLRNTTFYTWNRFYFLASLFLSAALPLIDLSILFPIGSPSIFPNMVLDPNIKVSGDPSLSREDYLLIVGGIGSLFFLVRLLVQLCSLLYLYAGSEKTELCGKRVVLLKTKSSPFSFVRWIFIYPALHTINELDEIIKHESIHARQGHTFDILLYELATALCWYNLLLWFMKQRVKQNLEYQADQQIVNSGNDRQHYQYHLLKVSQTPTYSGITNNFNFNHLKNRIMMMNKKQSARIGLLKYVLLIPVFAGMTLVLNAQEKLLPKNTKNAATKPAASVDAKEETTPVSTETIVFDKDVHDFGTVKEADGSVTAVFTFVNNGKTPLVVSKVQASCGCTTPEWTKEPVLPGEKGHIKAIYDVKGRIYPFDKTITVYSNGDPTNLVLHIKGVVEK